VNELEEPYMCTPTNPTQKCVILFKVQQKEIKDDKDVVYSYVKDEEEFVIGQQAVKDTP